MKCSQCGCEYDPSLAECPRCGAVNPEYQGGQDDPFQSSYSDEPNTDYYAAQTDNAPQQYDNGTEQSYEYDTQQQYYAGGQMPVAAQSNGIGIASMVLGIISLLSMGLVTGILAIVFSSMSSKKVGQNGFATAGKVMGIIGVVKGAIVLVVLIVLMAMSVSATGVFSDFYNQF